MPCVERGICDLLTRYHPVGFACSFSASLSWLVGFLLMTSLLVRTTRTLGAMMNVFDRKGAGRIDLE